MTIFLVFAACLLGCALGAAAVVWLIARRERGLHGEEEPEPPKRTPRDAEPATDDYSPIFRVRTSASGVYWRSRLIRVVGDMISVEEVRKDDPGVTQVSVRPLRYATVAMSQVHPDDRARAQNLAAAHPTARDLYEFQDDDGLPPDEVDRPAAGR